MRIKALLIEDNPGDARLVELMLAEARGASVDLVWVETIAAAIERLCDEMVDVILLDLGLSGSAGLDSLQHLYAQLATVVPVAPAIVVMTGLDDNETAVQAVQYGAQDYLIKGQISGDLLIRAMRYAIERSQSEEALRQAHASLEQRVEERTAALINAVNALQTEVGERKRAEEALRERETRIRRLVDSNIIGVFFWDLHGPITDANDAYLRIVCYTREDLAAGKILWTGMTPPEYAAADQRAVEELRSTGTCTPYEKEYVCKDGRRVPVLIGGAFLEGQSGKGVAFVLDLTERKRAEERIRYLAQHDALTALPNRLLFRDRLGQAIAQARRAHEHVAVLFIDLDHFKDINDSLGHPVGDRLLRVAARRLQRCLRQGDSVARLGGDEFVISLPALADCNDVLPIATKVLESLRRPYVVEQHELYVTGSIGISVYPSDGQEVEALMRAADTAMYAAKEKGRDNYQFFTPGLNEAAQRRLTIANRLHHALQREEFVLYYQPQVDLLSGHVSAAEALIRWQQPDKELILPDEFVHVAEDSGLIVALGEWVLRQACEQLRRWRAAGYPDMRVSVNLSPHQIRRAGFPDLVAQILRETELPPAALEMEITETVLMMQSQENVAALEQLARMGVRLAVDDFGTGYSSLAYLRRFPVHALKIDQSFVDGIGKDANDVYIVSAIIAMARSLNLKVVAEGVETAEQVAFLKQHGCAAAQGFYFSRAVSARAFTELLGARAAPATRGA